MIKTRQETKMKTCELNQRKTENRHKHIYIYTQIPKLCKSLARDLITTRLSHRQEAKNK